MRKHTKYAIVGRIKTKTINISTSLLLVLASLGGIVPFLASEHVFADTLNVCPVSCTYTSIQSAVTASSNGDTINVGAGTYTENVAVNKSVTLSGTTGTKLVVADGASSNGLSITANDVTITGFDIEGPANQSYLTYPWGGNVTRGVVVSNGVTGFTISDNTIANLRNDVLIDGRNTGSVTNNVIDNSKSGISIQYTDGSGVTITGNTEGTFGNDWGVNTHLNGHVLSDGVNVDGNNADKIAPDAPVAAQQVVKDLSSNNGGWTVQDQGYSTSNRTAVQVANGGIATAQGDPLGPIDTIQTGVNAVVTGGTVNVANGTYNESFAVTKDGVKVVGQSQAGVKVISSGTTPTGQAVTVIGAAGVSLSKMTFSVGSTGAPSYDFHSYQASNLTLSDLTFSGPGSSHTPKLGGVDINSTDGVTLNNVSIDGYSKNGLSFTAQNASGDPITKNVSITDVSSTNNAWSGMAFYNTTSTGANGHDITGVSFGGTNHLTGNGQVGLFVEGASDAQVASQTTPLYGITDGSGSPVNIHTTLFSGNGIQIYNYQPYGLTATSAQFDGLTGAAMTAAQRTTTDGTIIDHLDQSTLGLVTYYTVAPDAPTNPQWLNHDGDVLGAYTNVNLVTPSWTAPATGGVDHYEYSFTSPTDSNWSAPESFTGTSIPDQSFYGAGDNGTEGPWQFRVRSVNAAGDSSAWVESPVLTYDKTAPSLPTLLTPPNNGNETTNDFFFTWTASTDSSPVAYEFQSDNDGSFTNPWDSIANGNSEQNNLTSPKIHSTGAPDGTYFWRVRAIDAAGNKSGWTSPWKMTIDSQAPTGLANLSPSDGAHTTTAGLTHVDWTDATDATGPISYYYEVSNSPATNGNGSFVSPVYQSGALSDSQIPTPNTSAGVYYWHVKAVDADGNSTAWTTTWSFTIDNNAPTATLHFATPGPSATGFTVQFNEDVNASDATNPANYFLHNWPGAGGSGDLTGHATVGYDATTHIATVTFTTPGWYISGEQQWGVQNIHDLAGNLLSPNPTTAYSTPLVNPLAPGTPTTTSPTNSTSVNWAWAAATDPGGADASSVKGYFYQLKQGSTVIVPLTFTTSTSATTTVPGNGTYTLSVYAEDNASNDSSAVSSNVVVDTTAPATPVASPAGGNYTTAQLVSLSSTDDSGNTPAIYYTTDGSTPSSTNGTHYTGAFTVSSSETVEAIAYDDAGNASDVLTAVYTITPAVTTGGNNTNVTITNSNFQVAQTGNAQVLGDSTGGNAQSGDATNTNTTQVLGDSTTTPNGGQVKDDSTALKTNADTIKNSNFMVLGWWWIIVLAAIVGFFLLIGRRVNSEDKA